MGCVECQVSAGLTEGVSEKRKQCLMLWTLHSCVKWHSVLASGEHNREEGSELHPSPQWERLSVGRIVKDGLSRPSALEGEE